MCPCCTATITSRSSASRPSPWPASRTASRVRACSWPRAPTVASTCTPGPALRMAGARMNTCGWSAASSPARTPSESSTVRSQLSTWLPKKFRCTSTSRPPMTDWPPFFWPVTWSERKMRPAQVPNTGRPSATNFCSGSTRSRVRATIAMVVDSPPGITRPARSSPRSALLRTSRTRAPRRPRAWACSAKAPCRASTPTRGASATAAACSPGRRFFRRGTASS
mmetsp:Transcript_14834/g.50041  ORF Transcript_14834/g.50041 Transcript_14834/m.50041 type:complete len:223 (+) Transcript_14834:395-1063(+)